MGKGGIGCNSSFWGDVMKFGGIVNGQRGSLIKTDLSYHAPAFGTNKYSVADSLRLNPWQTNPVGMTTAGLMPNSNVLTAANKAAHQDLGIGNTIFKNTGLWF